MDSVRLDIWLDVACVFKTRSEAQRACKLGKVVINGVTAKPHRDVRAGDQLVISRPGGRKQQIVVREVTDKHLPKAQARELYEDRTPPPTPEEVEIRRLERLFKATHTPKTRPNRRNRRELQKMKWRSE